MLTNPYFLLAVSVAVIAVGLAKGGIAGLSVLAVPILALVVSPVRAAAIILPILIAQDVVTVWVFRGKWDVRLVAILLSGGIVGIGLGFALAAWVSQAAVELALGLICIVFGVQRLWAERKGGDGAARRGPAWTGVLAGVASGFTSQIAHAGAPPVQMYLLPRKLEREVLLGTMSLFFAALNWLKVPLYAALGQFTVNNLIIALVMTPIAVASTLAGAGLARSISGASFYRLIYVLMVLLGAKLCWDGVIGLA